MNSSFTSQRSGCSQPDTMRSQFAHQLSQAKNKAPVSIAWSQRLVLFFKGIPMVLGLFLMATGYWLLFVWDIKNLERRTRHYRLKMFNTWTTYFRPGTVAQWEEWRQSECAHCGACCEILWRCPFLKTDEQGNSHCSVHSKRPLPCRTFPIDPHSVELISKFRDVERSCSYRFAVIIDQWIEEDKKQKSNEDETTQPTSASPSVNYPPIPTEPAPPALSSLQDSSRSV